MASNKGLMCFTEKIKLNNKEKQNDLCASRVEKRDTIAREFDKYCKCGSDMLLALGKDFYI